MSISSLANGGSFSAIGSNSGSGSITISNGATLKYTDGNASTNRGVLLDGGGGGSVQITNPNASVTFSGVLSGTGGLTKTDVGTLVLSNSNTYTGQTSINSGTLSISSLANMGLSSGVGAGTADLVVSNGGRLLYTDGSTSTNRGLSIGSGGGIIDFSNTTVTITGAITGAGTLTKAGSGTLVVNNVRSAGLTVTAGTVQIIPDSTDNNNTSLVIARPTLDTGRLDLTNNKLVVNYPGAIPSGALTSVRNAIIAGRGKTDGFDNGETWNGSSGIMSSTAQSDVFQFGVGYAAVSDMPFSGYTTFAGQTVGSGSILVKFTRNGDTDLNGKVDDTDVGAIVTYYHDPNPATGNWAYGDMDYDGQVDDDDVTNMATFYNPSESPITPLFARPAIMDDFDWNSYIAELRAEAGDEFADAFQRGVDMRPDHQITSFASPAMTLAPEPSGFSILVLGAATILRRRRRKSGQ